ncbi:MAG: hypothetical protein Q4F65_14530, partial [Propionibacteriaceae bacterium]|nr:hypothetical protein [Propionibacteriaceae bacterium]
MIRRWEPVYAAYAGRFAASARYIAHRWGAPVPVEVPVLPHPLAGDATPGYRHPGEYDAGDLEADLWHAAKAMTGPAPSTALEAGVCADDEEILDLAAMVLIRSHAATKVCHVAEAADQATPEHLQHLGCQPGGAGGAGQPHALTLGQL